jgi:alpha-beta hydrolase superfamily lysophospholipase
MSHMRNLGSQWMTTSAASARGFVVIVPDYVGLGLDHDGHGNTIPHQFLANEASGYDLLYATKAAKKAWRQLGSKFVIMGHSQGGGAAVSPGFSNADDQVYI